MKNLFLIFAAVLTFFTSKATDNERFNKAMIETLVQFGQAKDITTYQEVANKFERIASSESAEWLPNYYASLTYTVMAIQQKSGSEIDKYLDKADSFIEKLAQQKVSNLDEIEVLKAQIAMMRISVDGQARYMKFGSAFEAAIAKAKSINPENPRAYALKAQMIFYTPEQFGGGAKNACPEIQKALEKFANFKATSPIYPNWGQEQIKEMAKACN